MWYAAITDWVSNIILNDSVHVAINTPMNIYKLFNIEFTRILFVIWQRLFVVFSP